MLPEPLKTCSIAAAVLAAIRADCAERYPAESCGILIGRDDAFVRHIIAVRPAANVWADASQRSHRYLIDPAAQLAAERDAASGGDAVVGFYHSHPDADPVPSARDAQAAWPVYSYLIVAVTATGATGMRCWTLDEHSGTFIEQKIVEI